MLSGGFFLSLGNLIEQSAMSNPFSDSANPYATPATITNVDADGSSSTGKQPDFTTFWGWQCLPLLAGLLVVLGGFFPMQSGLGELVYGLTRSLYLQLMNFQLVLVCFAFLLSTKKLSAGFPAFVLRVSGLGCLWAFWGIAADTFRGLLGNGNPGEVIGNFWLIMLSVVPILLIGAIARGSGLRLVRPITTETFGVGKWLLLVVTALLVTLLFVFSLVSWFQFIDQEMMIQFVTGMAMVSAGNLIIYFALLMAATQLTKQSRFGSWALAFSVALLVNVMPTVIFVWSSDYPQLIHVFEAVVVQIICIGSIAVSWHLLVEQGYRISRLPKGA